jgi:hypothetical protein
VILLTGTFEPFDRDRAIAAGCSEIITKPFEARKLVDTVERLIGGSDVQTPRTEDTGPSLAEDGDAWPEEATPVDAPTGTGPEEFGTQITAPESEEEGIEFTTTGFAEMEAAGRETTEGDDATGPDDGLEYEFDGPEVGVLDSTAPPVEPPPAEPDPSAQTVKIDTTSVDDQEPDEDVLASPEPAAEATVEPSGVDEVVDEPETAPEPAQELFTAALGEEPFETAEEDAGSIDDEPSMADTSPVEPPDEETGPDVEPLAADAPVQLTEDDIDRIARRVIELASDRLEQIAWEIIPDMAEIVVRQRIRELEAESDAAFPDSVQ